MLQLLSLHYVITNNSTTHKTKLEREVSQEYQIIQTTNTMKMTSNLYKQNIIFANDLHKF